MVLLLYLTGAADFHPWPVEPNDPAGSNIVSNTGLETPARSPAVDLAPSDVAHQCGSWLAGILMSSMFLNAADSGIEAEAVPASDADVAAEEPTAALAYLATFLAALSL